MGVAISVAIMDVMSFARCKHITAAGCWSVG